MPVFRGPMAVGAVRAGCNDAYRGKYVRGIIVLSILFIFSITPAFPFSDQTTSERILGENKDFITFVNICLTNFGKERLADSEKKFRDVYQDQFNAQVAYLQSEYKNTFYHIRSSQKKQIDLTGDVLKKIYLEDAKVVLDRLAPQIIRSKNARARLYLTLGYRDRAVGRNYEIVADASNPKLYSYKIYRYIEGIKLARRAKRYGLLALYESRDKAEKKEIFETLLKTEAATGNPFYQRFLNKPEKDIYREINKSYEDTLGSRKEQPGGIAPETSGAPAAPDAGKAEARLETTAEGTAKESVESKIEKRVRFRKERMTAEFLLHADYERAEDVIREYIEDFNFKLILSTLNVLSARKSDDVAGMDLPSMITHHYDNYGRIHRPYGGDDKKAPDGEGGKRTLLDAVSEEVKVIGDIRRENQSKNEAGAADKGKEQAKDQAK